jgi:hypothetical protein
MHASGPHTAAVDHGAESLRTSRPRHLANRPSTARTLAGSAEALEYSIVGINAGAAVSAATLDEVRSKLAGRAVASALRLTASDPVISAPGTIACAGHAPFIMVGLPIEPAQTLRTP